MAVVKLKKLTDLEWFAGAAEAIFGFSASLLTDSVRNVWQGQ